MNARHRILFAVPGLAGHVGPSLPIAKHLIAQGHHIGYATGAPMRSILAKTGVQYFYDRPCYQKMVLDKLLLVRSGIEYWRNAPKVFTVDNILTCFHELIHAVEDFQPEIIYIDTYDFLAVAVADKYHIPYAHGSAAPMAYLEKDIPLMGTGWDIHTPRWNLIKLIGMISAIAPFVLKSFLNQRAAMRAIDPTWKTTNYSGVSPYLYMFYSTDKFEYPRKMHVPSVFYVGPSIFEPDELPDFPWENLDTSKPMIYVATGSMFSEHYQEFYANVMKALDEKTFPVSIQVVMAVGKDQCIEKFGSIPGNFIVVPFAPQLKLLERSTVFISHGGNSVYEALSFGKPIFVAHRGGDRHDLGNRVAFQGAGLCLDVDIATPHRIRTGILTLLKQPRYARAAEGIMHSFRSCDGPKTAANLIVRLAETHQPILRKPGAPWTLKNFRDLPDYLS